MKDYKLTVEYKNLKTSCPGGVYLLPSHDDNRFFHGVIFIRRGAFCNGIFKFTLRCPTTYNDYGTHPQVTFSSYVYNPHVHPETGELDIPVAFPEWNPNKHFLPTVVTYLKRIFYVKYYKDMSDEEQAKIPNGETVLLLTANQSPYIPLGEGHRMANPGSIPLEIIEVQSGSYLGEDDIVRFEDTYGRAS